MSLVDVLVVDDNQIYARSLARHVGGDLRVGSATTIARGLELVEAYQPSVIVLDLNIGEEWGMDYVEDIRKLSPWSEIVISTGAVVTNDIISQAVSFDVSLIAKGDYHALSRLVREAAFVESQPTRPDGVQLKRPDQPKSS